jgi:hypothetical protein
MSPNEFTRPPVKNGRINEHEVGHRWLEIAGPEKTWQKVVEPTQRPEDPQSAIVVLQEKKHTRQRIFYTNGSNSLTSPKACNVEGAIRVVNIPAGADVYLLRGGDAFIRDVLIVNREGDGFFHGQITFCKNGRVNLTGYHGGS